MLYLMRHAQAETNHAMGDRARGLSPRGREQAREAGQLLAGRGVQLVLCSDSERTRQTYDELGLRLPSGEPVPVQYMAALYLGSADVIRQRISEIEDEVTGLLVIAHSPGIPTLGAELAWASQPKEADRLQCWFPTSAFSEFTVTGSWDELADSEHSAELSDVRRPEHDR